MAKPMWPKPKPRPEVIPSDNTPSQYRDIFLQVLEPGMQLPTSRDFEGDVVSSTLAGVDALSVLGAKTHTFKSSPQNGVYWPEGSMADTLTKGLDITNLPTEVIEVISELDRRYKQLWDKVAFEREYELVTYVGELRRRSLYYDKIS